MTDSPQELSSRYYWAEGAVWLLGGILLAFGLVGLAPGQTIPILQISPAENAQVPRVIAVGLFLITVYMTFEWRTSPPGAKEISTNRWRIRIAIFWTLLCISISFEKLLDGTSIAGLSFFWCLGAGALGYVIGVSISCIALAALTIRTIDEAKSVGLQRVPIAASAQFKFWIPIIILSYSLYYFLLSHCPAIGIMVASLTASIVYLGFVFESAINILFFSDPSGRRVPYKERIAQLREIHNMHDYMRSIASQALHISDFTSVTHEDSPEEIQRKIREKIARGCLEREPNYRGVLLDEIQIGFCPRDGNSDNDAIANLVPRIAVKENANYVRLRVVPFDKEAPAVDYRPRVEILERHADDFIRSLPTVGNLDIDVREMMDYILKKTVEEVVIAGQGSDHRMLELYIQRGDIESVAEVLRHKPNLDARGIGGWTALLHASANGYESITRMLLDAGANPDISNNLMLTPLMYGARYQNLQVCKILLEFGAKVNLQDIEGYTALMKACEVGSLELVELLIREGADLEISDRAGKTALDIAHSCGHGAIAKLIRNIGKNYEGRSLRFE